MPSNKSALIRYKVIDECLRNKYRNYTLNDLVDTVSDALYEYEGIDNGISVRTIQLDIQTMRSDKLGYNAPIIVFDKKYYKYDDENYSITNLPITSVDLDKMNEAVGLLRQFKGFSYFTELTDMISKLESKIHSSKNDGVSYIQFEKNDLLKGLEYIEPIHKAIINKKAIKIKYQSFKAKEESEHIYIPYLLKEYRNRWFVLIITGKNRKNVLTLALDRINSIEVLENETYIEHNQDFILNYYEDVIGVSKTLKHRASNIVLKINKQNYPYIVTKPLHSSQTIIEEQEDGIIFNIKVIWNFELEREIMGYGEMIEVISPERLKRKIERRHKESNELYKQEN